MQYAKTPSFFSIRMHFHCINIGDDLVGRGGGIVFSFLLVACANERKFDVYSVGSIPLQQIQYSRTNAILIQLRDFNHGLQVAYTLDNAGWYWVSRHRD